MLKKMLIIVKSTVRNISHLKKLGQIMVAAGLIFWGLSLPDIISASGPENGSEPASGQVIGFASDALACLAVGNGAPAPASETINLTWPGQAERARLVLDVAGSEAAHTIKVNGQAVAQVPIYPNGQPCGDGEYVRIDIPHEVLVQGDNLIEITDDALPGDNWTAANVRLEVFGNFSTDEPEISPADVSVAATQPIFSFTNLYDGSSQEAIAQIPTGYNGSTPLPLLIAVHARSGTKEDGLDWFDQEAENRGWLLASPELHGHWPIPDECKSYPNSCDYDDKVLAGTTSASADPKPGAYAYASLESQYDVIGTVDYMVQNYNVDPNRIYLAGYSMGGQGSVIIAAKFPHLFAAVFDNKGPTNMVEWYGEQVAYYGSSNANVVRAMRKECYVKVGGTNTPAYPSAALGTPANPFCFQRRSGVNFASNFLHTPISVTHSLVDAIVPIHHSQDLVAAINSFGPDQTASLYVDTVVGPTCTDGGAFHCYKPDPAAVLTFLGQYTLNNTPTHINITTDESKSYYWLDIDQTGGEHWTQVEVTKTGFDITASISDTNQLTLGFNLGAGAITDIIPQPGLGLPPGIYSIKGGGNDTVAVYTSGYLPVTVSSATSPFNLTISLIDGGEKVYLPIVVKN